MIQNQVVQKHSVKRGLKNNQVYEIHCILSSLIPGYSLTMQSKSIHIFLEVVMNINAILEKMTD